MLNLFLIKNWQCYLSKGNTYLFQKSDTACYLFIRGLVHQKQTQELNSLLDKAIAQFAICASRFLKMNQSANSRDQEQRNQALFQKSLPWFQRILKVYSLFWNPAYDRELRKLFSQLSKDTLEKLQQLNSNILALFKPTSPLSSSEQLEILEFFIPGPQQNQYLGLYDLLAFEVQNNQASQYINRFIFLLRKIPDKQQLYGYAALAQFSDYFNWQVLERDYPKLLDFFFEFLDYSLLAIHRDPEPRSLDLERSYWAYTLLLRFLSKIPHKETRFTRLIESSFLELGDARLWGNIPENDPIPTGSWLLGFRMLQAQMLYSKQKLPLTIQQVIQRKVSPETIFPALELKTKQIAYGALLSADHTSPIRRWRIRILSDSSGLEEPLAEFVLSYLDTNPLWDPKPQKQSPLLKNPSIANRIPLLPPSILGANRLPPLRIPSATTYQSLRCDTYSALFFVFSGVAIFFITILVSMLILPCYPAAPKATPYICLFAISLIVALCYKIYLAWTLSREKRNIAYAAALYRDEASDRLNPSAKSLPAPAPQEAPIPTYLIAFPPPSDLEPRLAAPPLPYPESDTIDIRESIALRF